MGLTTKQIGEYEIVLSTRERAMMEYLDLVPELESYSQAIYLMEGLKTLRPNAVQELLEKCRSIKVKRLFMHLAEESNHAWVNYVSLSKVNFGSGKRVISGGGKFHSKYNLSVPEVRE